MIIVIYTVQYPHSTVQTSTLFLFLLMHKVKLERFLEIPLFSYLADRFYINLTLSFWAVI